MTQTLKIPTPTLHCHRTPLETSVIPASLLAKSPTRQLRVTHTMSIILRLQLDPLHSRQSLLRQIVAPPHRHLKRNSCLTNRYNRSFFTRTNLPQKNHFFSTRNQHRKKDCAPRKRTPSSMSLSCMPGQVPHADLLIAHLSVRESALLLLTGILSRLSQSK